MTVEQKASVNTRQRHMAQHVMATRRVDIARCHVDRWRRN